MNNYIIYALKEPQSDIVRYIGITNNLTRRFNSHLSDKDKTHKTNWIKSLRLNNLMPDKEILEDNITREDAIRKEKEYISLFKSFGAPLVNSANGGVGSPGVLKSEETRKKISEKNKGRKLSDEHKAKIIKHLLGRPASQKVIESIIRRNKERIYTQSNRDKLSFAARNRSSETRRKLSDARKGKKDSPETIAKKIRGLTGRILSQESKNKISLSQPNRRSVSQFDTNGCFIKKWNSIADAVKNGYRNCEIIRCCNNKRNFHKGFRWFYSDKLLPILF